MKAFKINVLAKNYLFNYLSITPLCNQRSPVNTGSSAPPLPLGYVCYSFFEATPYLCQTTLQDQLCSVAIPPSVQGFAEDLERQFSPVAQQPGLFSICTGARKFRHV